MTRFNRDGLNRTEKRDKKIIVSLTSSPARIKGVPYTIASLLNQTMKPDKIILWLGDDRFPDRKLPKIFDKLKACGVDIEFREDLGPHTKYYYAMKEFPEDIVITFDDDWIYRNDLIEKMYKSYINHPSCVNCMQATKIAFLEDGSIGPDSKWDYRIISADVESFRYSAIGVWGVLYPPHSVHEEIFNVEAIKKLCPKADDVWLKFMEVMKGFKVVSVGTESTGKNCIYGSQGKESLWIYNIANGGNDKQLKAVIEAYNNWTIESTGKTILQLMWEDK